MDSVTQAVLGAAVGVAVMGRHTAPWKAAAWGAVCGTAPDLDVFIDHGDPIRNMTLHRTESHSLFFLTLASPLVAWVASRLHRNEGGFQGGEARFQGGEAGFRRWWLALWLALVTHPLLDLMTVYGTQLLLPFTDHPYAVGSVFVIDPFYTLPLLAGLVAALVTRRHRPAGLRWLRAALLVSTAYLAAGVAVQAHVRDIAEESLDRAGIRPTRLLVTPTPFNIVLWRALAMTEDGYVEGFHSLLDAGDEIDFTRHPSDVALYRRHADNWSIARIAWFSHGFFSVAPDPEGVVIRDLRMGQEPFYTFTFLVPRPALDPSASGPVRADPARPRYKDAPGALQEAAVPAAQVAARQLPMRVDLGTALPQLWRRMLGDPSPLRLQAAPAPQGGS
jgi:inner membrane protein